MKTYEKDGDFLKETTTEIIERLIEVKSIKRELKFINDEIDRLKLEKIEKQALLDKCTELNIKEI